MSHVLLGTKDDDYAAILDAGQNGHDLPVWVIPKKAKPGDPVVLFLPAHGFVAGAEVGSDPLVPGYFGKRPVFRGRLTGITLLPVPVPIAHVAREMPEWDWARYTRTFTTVEQSRFDALWGILLGYQGEATDAEVPKPYRSVLLEGQARRAIALRYERNPKARLLCIQHHGTSCSICGFNFGVVYGDAFQGFIVVHHLEPISTKPGPYEIDPVRDMRPVCANCHLVIHRRTMPYSIDEVTEMLPEGWFDDAAESEEGAVDGAESDAGK